MLCASASYMHVFVRLPLVAIALAMALGITSCGGGTPPQPSSPPPPPPQPTTPSITNLEPSEAPFSGYGWPIAQFGLKVQGSGFSSGSKISWGGMEKTTTFISVSELRATILIPADLQTSGDLSIVVQSPNAVSNPKTFRVYNSVGTLSRLAEGYTYEAAVSADGRWLVTSTGTEVSLIDTCRGVTDSCTATTTSIAKGFLPVISATGRFIVFVSKQGLVSDDTNGRHDVYLHDTCFGVSNCAPATSRVSLDESGQQIAADSGLVYEGLSFFPSQYDQVGSFSMSSDARFVAFTSALMTETVSNVIIGPPKVLIRDTCIGVENCSPRTVVVATNGVVRRNSLSANGRYVTFTAGQEGIDFRPAGIYFRDTCLGVQQTCSPVTKLVSVGVDGVPIAPVASLGNSVPAYGGALSADGRYVTLVAGAELAAQSVLLHDTCSSAVGTCLPKTTALALPDNGWKCGTTTNGYSLKPVDDPVISADARLVIYRCRAAAQDPVELFFSETCIGAPAGCVPYAQRVSQPLTGIPIYPPPRTVCGHCSLVSGESYSPAIFSPARLVIFVSEATNLVSGDTNGKPDVFLARTN
jgi:hypothetical protein